VRYWAERRTVADLLEQWLEHKAGRGRSVTTLREYRRLIDRQLKPRFGDLPLDRVTGRDLDRYYDELVAAGLATATVRQVHAVMRGALGQAVKWDWLHANPALKATLPHFGPRLSGRTDERPRPTWLGGRLRGCRSPRSCAA